MFPTNIECWSVIPKLQSVNSFNLQRNQEEEKIVVKYTFILLQWTVKNKMFTESAPRQTESISCNVCIFSVCVCLYVYHWPGPGTYWTEDFL